MLMFQIIFMQHFEKNKFLNVHKLSTVEFLPVFPIIQCFWFLSFPLCNTFLLFLLSEPPSCSGARRCCPSYPALSGLGPDTRSKPTVRARSPAEQQLVLKGETGECFPEALQSVCVCVLSRAGLLLEISEHRVVFSAGKQRTPLVPCWILESVPRCYSEREGPPFSCLCLNYNLSF